jgi:hypothetical protein
VYVKATNTKGTCVAELFGPLIPALGTFLSTFKPKKFPEKTWAKIYQGQDPYPVKNRPDLQHRKTANVVQ